MNVVSMGGLHFFGRPLKQEVDSAHLLEVHLDAGLTFEKNTGQL